MCPGRESNPHGPFGPRDFLTTTAFAAVIWSRQNHCNSEVWPIWITFVVRTISWPYCNLASVGVSVYNSNLINVRCIYSHTRHYSSRSLLFGKILLLYSISLSIVSTHCLILTDVLLSGLLKLRSERLFGKVIKRQCPPARALTNISV